MQRDRTVSPAASPSAASGLTERIIATALSGSAILLVIAASGVAGGFVLLLVMLAGLGTGVAGPSRDLLIKRATPAGATGRVYGTVYSGLDAGLAVSAPVLVWLMDHDLPRSIFFGAATAMLVAMLIGLAIGRVTRRQREQQRSANTVSRATEDEHRNERRYVHATFGNFHDRHRRDARARIADRLVGRSRHQRAANTC